MKRVVHESIGYINVYMNVIGILKGYIKCVEFYEVELNGHPPNSWMHS